jgi:ATP/maltotriose-dependent transcriptional regulator MalT
MTVTASDLVAREKELARLEQLLARAREGVSGALVLCAPAGMGKTALLDAAAGMADGFEVLRARGIEGESQLPYAGLSQLLLRVMDERIELAPRERQALESALALGPPGEHDRVAIAAAVLSLLAVVAEGRPLLVVVDDLHWVDEASRAVLRIAGRRLVGEGIALLMATRPEVPPPSGIASLELEPLPERGARELLARTLTLPPVVERRVLETAAGNPLALLEIPHLLRDASPKDPSAPGVTAPLPAGTTIERALMAPVERLPERTRTALLVAAVDERAPRAVLDVALARAGIDAGALLAAERAGLVTRGDGGVTFRHPLLRSAIYHAASGPERRAAHAALAAAWPQGGDRWTWHAAGAALGPDETVASALGALADRAHDRGAHLAAARAWRRAAELSPSALRRYERRLSAANELIIVGDAEEAARLLDLARDEAPPGASRARLEVLQGRLALRRENPQSAHRALVRAADEVAATEPVRASEILVEASMARQMAGDLESIHALSARALELADGRDEVAATSARLMLGHVRVALGDVAGGEALMLEAAAAAPGLRRTPPSVEAVAQCAHVALWGDRYDIAEPVLDWLDAGALRAGAAGARGMPLAVRARMQMRRGRLVEALATADEAVELAESTGQHSLQATVLAFLAEIEALLGREADARAHAGRALEMAHGIRAEILEIYAHTALATLELGYVRMEAAVEHLTRADTLVERMGITDPGFVFVRPMLVDALHRVGETGQAERLLAEYEERAEASGRLRAQAAAARCRGLLADDGEYEDWFARALELYDRIDDPIGRSATLLALGARRRRSRRRAASREPLQEALALFERVGAMPWAWQVRHELELAGAGTEEDALRLVAAGSALEELTPQELRVALLVGRGLANRQVAGELFVSTRTVEAHLRQIYRKLDLRSRTELARLVAGLDG